MQGSVLPVFRKSLKGICKTCRRMSPKEHLLPILILNLLQPRQA
ncbi:Uncharacterised protein [Mycobacteroides abscessus subsp. abscessus]|nr:Uncharacterised protein [Mycobacteroides abscessus subsp. abscessus]